ncbi:MAG: hypothetical protein IPJ20_10060 [Flammeovirgaceae bacterium]|nr:hypothetical protein [Flammeovirgaceae bacterium]
MDLAENVFTYKADYDILQKLIDYPEVTLESGEKVKASNVDHRMYDNRNDREKLYKATYGSKDKYSDLYNSYFAAKVNHFYFLSQLYNDSTSITYLQRTRSDPDYAYTTLLNAIYANLSVHYRYLNLMRKILSIDTLQSWDLEHVPRGNNKTSYPLNLGLVIIQKAMSPYGKRYSDIIKKSYENRWIDAFKSSSKGYRVFAEDVPGVHPYVSVEYDNSYTAVRSLAHELGHCIHYKISADVLKPPFNEFYSLLQEVPSNVNESLINDYLIKTESKDRLSVLYETLFYLTGTLFSHAIEAETDYELHKK